MNAVLPRQNGAAKSVAAALSAVPRGPRSEATQVEQSRAVAEVQAMVTVAQAHRRDITRAMESMRQSCAMMGLAERAFFKFPRGGQTVAGPSIHLAVELARCWGNVNYGIRELSRDDYAGQSEMLAFAWDMETNARADTTFIVPHMRDKKGGAEALTDMRDIYENNANNGARRLREMIFRILPPWYREKAKLLCQETLANGEGEQPLPLRIANVVAGLAGLGIGRERIEAKIGMNVDEMTPLDLANLIVAARSIKAGEVSANEEFPPVTAAEVSKQLASPAPSQPPQATRQDPQTSGQAAPSDAPDAAAGADSQPEGAGQPAATAVNWHVEGVVGEANVIKAIKNLIDTAPREVDVRAVLEQNGDRLSKMSMMKRDDITRYAEARIVALGAE